MDMELSPKRGRYIDLTGQRFGHLVAVAYEGRKNKKSSWYVKCDCGNLVTSTTDALRLGRKTHCGCASGGHFRTIEKLRERNDLYEKTLCTLLSVLINEGRDELADVIIGSLNGRSVPKEYRKNAKEGLEILSEVRK